MHTIAPTQGSAGSRILLSISERVGELLAKAQGNSELNEPIQISRPNIGIIIFIMFNYVSVQLLLNVIVTITGSVVAMSAKEYEDLADIDSNDFSFPEQLLSTAHIKSAQIQLPQSLVKEKLSQSKFGKSCTIIIIETNVCNI